MKLRDDRRLWDEVYTEVAQHAKGTTKMSALRASTEAILYAMERAIDHRTPTAPPEPPTETWCQRCDGLVTDAAVVQYAGTTPPPLCRCAGPRRKTPAVIPGTAPTPPTCLGHTGYCPLCDPVAGTPRGDE
jgi:hypothetical protein